MQIDKNKIYELGKYSYINFCQLKRSELLEILEWRNHPDIRKCMNTSCSISVDSHLNFCESLKSRNDKYYWLVKRNEKPIGVLNIIDVDEQSGICEPGFYLVPALMGKGESIFFLSNYKTFLLKVLKFKTLIGHNYYDNMSAFIFTMFFGAEVTAIERIHDRLSIKTTLSQENLQNEEGTDKLILKYFNFLKHWNADQVINTYKFKDE